MLGRSTNKQKDGGGVHLPSKERAGFNDND